jgi:hypothetical protein
MNNNLFKIDDSEKMRILEMHQSATSRHYLGEQVAPATTTTTTTAAAPATAPSPTDIPGFVWAEGDNDWVTKNGITDDIKVSAENFNRFLKYYESGNIIGKFVVIFNKVDNDYPYLRANFYTKFMIANKSVGTSKIKGGTVTRILSGTDLTKPYVDIFANGGLQYCQNNNKCFDLPSPVEGIRKNLMK